MRKVEPLPNRDCEAGYGPVEHTVIWVKAYVFILLIKKRILQG